MSSPFVDNVDRYGKHWQTPWLYFGAFVILATCIFFVLGPIDRRHIHVPVKIEKGDSFKIIAAIGRARRAVVFLDATWSTNAKDGRQYFKDAASQLSRLDLPSVEFLILDEWPLEEDKQDERDHTQAWLASLDLKGLTVGGGYGIGGGSILWMEENKVIAEEWSARSAKTSGIVKRTQALWGR